jgi:uncharacterized protein (TIGR02145 family)
MKTTRFLALTAISIALTFTFSSCSGDDGDDTPSNTNSSSSVGNTGGGDSSSSGGNDSNDHSKTVEIGGQTWKKYNLNVQSNSGKGNSWCNNCNTYGRHYDWAAAMNLPSSCNRESCADQINNPHQGLCPDGFHIPTEDELNALLNTVGDDGLEDADGFAALRAGRHRSTDGFSMVGVSGYWWSTYESDVEDANALNLENQEKSNEVRASIGGYVKERGFSVRCIQNN